MQNKGAFVSFPGGEIPYASNGQTLDFSFSNLGSLKYSKSYKMPTEWMNGNESE